MSLPDADSNALVPVDDDAFDPPLARADLPAVQSGAEEQAPSLTALAERAAAAIGRLDGALLHHPLAAAWSLRARIEGAIQACAWNGWKVEKSRLCAILAGVHLKLHRDEGAEARAVALIALLGDMQNVADLKPLAPAELKATGRRAALDPELLSAAGGDYVDIEGHREHGAVMVEFGRAYLPQAKTPLLAIAELAAQVRYHREALPGVLHYAVPKLLAEWRLTSSPLPGLAAFPPRREGDDLQWKMDFLKGLQVAAERGLARLVEIGHVWDRSLAALGERRSNSRAVEAMLLAISMPALSPSALAAMLSPRNGRPGATVRGATLILDDLVGIGLLEELPTGRRKEEVSGRATRRRGAWRSYCLTEFGVGYEARPSSSTLPSPPRAAARMAAASAADNLDALLDGLNLAIERSSALLAKHGIVKPGD